MNTSFERTEQKDEWLTPRYIIEALGPFDLDPCAPVTPRRPWATAAIHYTIEDNGLLKSWKTISFEHSFVWCNPPYGNQTQKWFHRMAEHNNGIALTFARTETKMFFDSVWSKAVGLLFIRGRLQFCDFTGRPKMDANGRPQGAGAPSVLIAYGIEAFERLEAAHKNNTIKGALVKL